MHILVMDKCNRLTYQLIQPWSAPNYPYVKAAILSTYIDNPCGDCNKTSTMIENSTSPPSTTESGILSRYDIPLEATSKADSNLPFPLVNTATGITATNENTNYSVAVETASNSFLDKNRNKIQNATNYFQYSTLLQQANISNTSDTQNVNGTLDNNLYRILHKRNLKNHTFSNHILQIPSITTEDNDENEEVSNVSAGNTSESSTTTYGSESPESTTEPQSQENPSVLKNVDQSVKTEVNFSTTSNYIRSTEQPHDNSTRFDTNISVDETRIEQQMHSKNDSDDHKAAHGKFFHDRKSHAYLCPRRKVVKHRGTGLDDANTTAEAVQGGSRHWRKPSKCKRKPISLAERTQTTSADRDYAHGLSPAVSTDVAMIGGEPSSTCAEEGRGGGRNALDPGVDETLEHPDDGRKAPAGKTRKKCPAKPKQDEIHRDKSAELPGQSPPTQPTRTTPPQENVSVVAAMVCPERRGEESEEGVRYPTANATEEETIRQYEELSPWLEYIL
ncbi:uncharacterized protein LOC134537631 [Bacillus rossius redtenbacheri]|uniref:uncharacterized protein LOC134537631 n=1 Tax=Bacillus rossius redtenbacheri TaxID=93214 RepID=UPI002FDE6029